MKVILILIAILLGLIGLLMSACGLIFAVGTPGNWFAMISLIIGVGLCWLARVVGKAANKSGAAPSDGGSTGAGSG